jgi:importin-4
MQMTLAVTSAEVVSAFSSGSSPSNAIAIVDDSDATENEEDVDLDKLLDVNSAIAVEKEIAADTIGTLFTATSTTYRQRKTVTR